METLEIKSSLIIILNVLVFRFFHNIVLRLVVFLFLRSFFFFLRIIHLLFLKLLLVIFILSIGWVVFVYLKVPWVLVYRCKAIIYFNRRTSRGSFACFPESFWIPHTLRLPLWPHSKSCCTSFCYAPLFSLPALPSPSPEGACKIFRKDYRS